MQLSETQLRRMITEEIYLKIVDQYITEELVKFLREQGEDADDEDLLAYKNAARSELSSYVKKGLLPLALGAALLGFLNQKTTTFSDAQSAMHQARVEANVDAANTDEAQFDELVDQLNNQYAFRWGKGSDSVVHAPGSDGKVTVLPPSYSVMVKVMQDKKANAERMDQGLKPFQRYGHVDSDLGLDHDRTYSGDYEGNIDTFFTTHKGDFVDAMTVLGDHDELQVVPGSGMEQQIIMVDPDKISGDYYLPELGMTAEDYYNYQYGEYMGSGEAAAIDSPDEEMIVTPDDDSEKLDQGLIDATNKRAELDRKKLQRRNRNMKENKITWQNYKNRKKMLA
tara:strand:- start:2889 stop:3905 length:1017 start_codon:yes stop_codon:yes gene_type:complete